MAAMPFPILTFNEALLSPSFGYVFDRRWLDPYESLVSMLWKFTWMNRLAGQVVVEHVARGTVDPYEGVAATTANIDILHVARTLGVTTKSVRQTLQRSGSQGSWCPLLRICPPCMSRGYHGVVHQVASELHCPVHRCPLLTSCRGCGASSAYHIDARLLGAPFRCSHCRRRHAGAEFVRRNPLPAQARTAITRTFLGLGHKNLPGKAGGRR
jgi:hypothetical protein